MSHRHEDRTDLAGEHMLTDIGQIIGLLIFLAVWIPDSFVFHFTTFFSTHIPVFIRYPISGILFILSFYMAKTGLKIVFGEIRETPTVINKSVFKWTRHPIYLSELILYFGLFLLTFSFASLFVILLVFTFLNYIASVEEKKLEKMFGNKYLEYKEKVGKWFPKPWKK